MITATHKPVLLEPAVASLLVKPGAWYIDATFGRGGHTRRILELGGYVVALDVDQEAINYGREEFATEIAAQQLILVRENFDKLISVVKKVLSATQQMQVQGILFDFGTSADQLTSSTRGFSFIGEGELDMRMDTRLGVQAKDLLMILSEKQLTKVFRTYGGEKEASRIAREIVKIREYGDASQLSTIEGLVSLISQVKREKRSHLHPATKVFQALRIAVNDELQVIETALPQAWQILQPGGRLVTIAFHEGEDRIVKKQFQAWNRMRQGKILTKHPLTADEEEQKQNTRSRSAKMRIFEK